VEQACKNTLPIKNFKPKSKGKEKYSWEKELKQMQRLKLNHLSKYKKKQLLNTLHGVEIKIQDILTVSRKQEEEKAIKENPKFFYKYAVKYSKTKSNIGPLIDEQGQSVQEPKEIAEKLRLQYESVFSQSDPEKKI